MSSAPLSLARLTRWALVTIAVCLAIQTLERIVGGSDAMAQYGQQQRQVMDVYLKGIDLPVTENVASLFRGVQINCQVSNEYGMPLRVKQVDDDLVPRQPKN